MLKKLELYIIYNYFIKLTILISLFLSLIWLSQILRILDIKFSLTGQILNIIFTTIFVLPSFLNPLLPLILLLSYFFINYFFINNNEITIINLNFKNSEKKIITLFIGLIVFIFSLINNELISPKSYKIYKEGEIKLRNNFKIGIPYNNQLHLEDGLSIFFEKRIDNIYFDIEAILISENQFIVSKKALLENNKIGLNLTFIDGFKINLNSFEKSKTKFEKFILNLQKKELSKITFDKEHYNTYELLNSNNKELKYHGHYKVFNYLFLIIIFLISRKIIFQNRKNNNLGKNILTIFIIVLIYLVNSFLNYNLVNYKISLLTYYLINVVCFLLLINYSYKFDEIN